MKSLRNIVVLAASAALFAGCMHHQTMGMSSGEVADAPIDSLTAMRTAILRVDNNYASEVQVYTVIAGKKNYVAKAQAGQTRTFVLDPNLFPIQAISFEAHAKDGSMTQMVGPFNVNKGELVDLIVPADFTNTHASVRHSMQ